MKNIKKVISILLIILLCMTYFNINKAYAKPDDDGDVEVTLESARENLASWSEAFCAGNASRCRYNWDRRGETYLRQVPNSSDPYYYFDCVGWVSFAINRAIGLDYAPAHKGYNKGGSGFVTPSGVKDRSHFAEIPISQAKRGDILIAPSAPHVAIYLGNGRIVDMWDSSTTLGIRSINESYVITSWTSCRFTSAATLISIDGVNFGELPGGIDIGDLGDLSNLDAMGVDLDYIDFKYSGMPKKVTNAGGHSLMFYIDKISDAFDYLIGIMLNGIKVTVAAVLNGIETILSNVLDSLN